MSAALNLSVCFQKNPKKQENKKTEQLSLWAFQPFQLLRPRSDLSIAPKIRVRCSQGCKLHKTHQKRDEVWKVLPVPYLMRLQQPGSPSAASSQAWKFPPCPAEVEPGSKEQQRCCELPPQPPRTDKPPLNSADLCKQKPSHSGQAIFSLKEAEPTESFGKVQNLLAATLGVKYCCRSAGLARSSQSSGFQGFLICRTLKSWVQKPAQTPPLLSQLCLLRSISPPCQKLQPAPTCQLSCTCKCFLIYFVQNGLG